MSAAKHTPGPWATERVYLTIEDPTMRITAHGGALYVAEAAYSHVRGERAIHVTDADEMRANAHLMAAAPALLQELRDLLEAVDSMRGTFGCIRGETPEDSDVHTHDKWAEEFLQERADAARAVLARAEGGTQ